MAWPGGAQSVSDAEVALSQGQPAEALDILDLVEPADVVDPLQFLFVEGLAAIEAGQFDRAIRAFERMVTQAPDLARPRLELARVYFLTEDDANARRQFELVRGGISEPTILANIDQFLDEIEARRRIRYSFSIGLAPDTNINAATEAATVDLAFFGLPFTVPPESRAQSGVGLETAIGADFRTKPSDQGGRWTGGANLFAREYNQDRFNDRLISVEAGRSFRVDAWRVDFGPRISLRETGGTLSQRSHGVGVSAERMVNPTTQLKLSLGQDLQRNLFTDFSTIHISANAQLTRAVSARARAGLTFALDRFHGEALTEERREISIGALYYTEFDAGLTLAVRPRVTHSTYDERINFISGDRRKDLTVSLPIEVSHRRLRIAGFQPYAQVTWESRESVHEFFEYDRRRLFGGISRRF